MKKRSLSILLTLALLIGMIPFTAIPAFAYEGEEYFTFREWDGTEVVTFDDIPLSDFEPLTEITDTTSVLGSGWYVVKGENVVISDSLTINGTAGSIDNATNIILMDGACLTVQKGINIQYGNSLIIYGQRNDSGRLVAYAENDGAAIGGSGSFGSLTVNGGTVEATGNTFGTGIGGGDGAEGGSVVINGGKVIAKGYGGAGIGNGGNAWSSGGTVDIHGGIVEASSERGGAAIGGGSGGNGANVTITGGTVTATSYNAAIGGGAGASSHGSLSIYEDAYIMVGSEAPGSHTSIEKYINSRSSYISVNAPSEEGHTYSWVASFDKAKNIYALEEKCVACEKVKRSYKNDFTGYSAVDHIDVTGGAYIDTGYYPTNNTHVAMDVVVNGTKEYWFGVWDKDYKTNVFALCNDGKEVYAGYMNNGGGDGADPVPVTGSKCRIELNKNEVFIDGVRRASVDYAYEENAVTLARPLYLFTENQAGNAWCPDEQKITCYGCEIYENGEIERFYVPCVYCGCAGLYDLAEGKFYGSRSTEGQIIPYSENKVKAEGKAVSCTEDGYDACYVLGSKIFADEACTQEITDFKTWSGFHPALGHDWETDAEKHTCARCKLTEAHIDKNNDGYCDICNFDLWETDRDIPYLNKTVDVETGKVTTEEVRFTGHARGVAQAGTVWGNIGSDTWLVLDEDITLDNRPEVKGNVHLILLNGKTLTANKGITVEANNSLSVFAQSESKSEMGCISMNLPEGESGIGGRKDHSCGIINICGGIIDITAKKAVCIGGGNGSDGTELGEDGRNGCSGGTVYILGGDMLLTGSENACVGGGRGGNGIKTRGNISRNDDGGNGGYENTSVYFYGGTVHMKNDGVCVGGGNGGDAGPHNGNATAGGAPNAKGGNGGNSIKVYFYGGSQIFDSENGACLGAGKGGHGDKDPKRSPGADGSDGTVEPDFLTITGTPVMKAGEDVDHAQPVSGYDNQKYFSVAYMPGENDDPAEALSYLEKTFTDGSVVTETKMLTSYTPVTAETTNLSAVQGATETWYVVDNDITFSERIKISGNINLLLLNGKTLTANKGITLEDENILTVYAQSDDPAVMGELIANSNTGDAGIGGCAGKDGNSNPVNGEKGMPAGTFCQKGGKVTVTAETGTCIGGGKGGNGGAAQSAVQSVLAGIGGAGGETSFFGGITILTGKTGIGGGNGGKGGITGDGASHGERGGNAKNFSVYAGDITINTSDGVCIGGGNGGDAGTKEELVGSGGGDGGNGGNMSFIGGIVKAQSKAFSCFGGGKGGKGSMGSMYRGAEGHNGQQAVITIGDGLAAYSMNDDGTAGEMIVSEDISNTLNNISKVIITSTVKPGPIPDITHIHTPELQEGLLPTYDASGFMPYYKCTDETCGRYFENEACTTEITDIDAWKAEGGNGYLAPLEKSGYIFIAGENSKWTKGSKDGLTVSCSGPINELAGVYMDGKLIDESCYNKYPGYIGLEISEDNLGEFHGQTMTLKNTTSATHVIGLVLGLVIDNEQLSELFGQCEKKYVCNPDDFCVGGSTVFVIPGKTSENAELVKPQLGHGKIHTFDNFELPTVKPGSFICVAPIFYNNESDVRGRVALASAIKIGEQKGLVGDEVITSPVHPGAYVGGGSIIHIIDNNKDPKRAAIFSPYSYSSNDIDLSDFAFTDIELKPEYLETLAVGNHTLKLVYKDGTEVSTNIEIAAKAATDYDIPETGDDSSMLLWIVLMLISGGIIAAVALYGKKRKLNNQ